MFLLQIIVLIILFHCLLATFYAFFLLSAYGWNNLLLNIRKCRIFQR